MYRSPQQRFQRTATLYVNQNTAVGNPAPQRCGSPKHYKLPQHHQTQFDLKSKSKLFQDEKVEAKQKVEDKIVNLQRMLQHEKSKRQTEFSQLFKMINSLRQRKKNQQQSSDPSFNYNEHEQPLTPRVKTKQNQFTKSPRQQNYHTYTPAYETVTKPKQSRYKNSYRQDDSFFQRSLQDFSFKSLQLLLMKIERESEFNNRNVIRMQEQMISMRSNISNLKTKTGIPIQVQKYVRDSFVTLKNQMETQRNSMKFSLIDMIQQKIKQKLGENKSSTLLKKQQQLERNLTQLERKSAQLERKSTQNSNKIQSIESTNQFLGAQMKALDEKLESQINCIHEIIQQKNISLSEAAFNKPSKNEKQNIQYLLKEIQCQKIKIEEIQETNLQFFENLEQTIKNIQQKFKSTKNEENSKQIVNAEIFQKKLQSQSENIYSKLKGQCEQMIKNLSLELGIKIRKVEEQIQGIDVFLIKNQKQKLTKYNSLNDLQPIHQYMSQSDNNFLRNNELVNQIIDKQLQETAQFYRKDSQDACEEHQKIIELISENCSFLQSRNCTIQESVTDVICVLNNIVEKLRYVM